jgi:hypothetical protein
VGHVARMGHENYTKFCLENLKGRDYSKDQGLVGVL